MTGGEVLIEQGRQEGLRKGRLDGRLEGSRPVFLALLRARFREVSAAATRRVESASFEEIERWVRSVDSARTAEELLAL